MAAQQTDDCSNQMACDPATKAAAHRGQTLFRAHTWSLHAEYNPGMNPGGAAVSSQSSFIVPEHRKKAGA